MKKKLLSVVLILALILSFQSASIATTTLEDLSKNEPEDEIQVEDSAIVVGYLESDKKDIFGDLSDEEISEIIIEICDTIENADSSIEKNNMIQGLDSRIVILDGHSEKSNEINNTTDLIDEIDPLGRDEEAVNATYNVYVRYAGKTGHFKSSLTGIVNYGKYAVIDGLYTYHYDGEYFQVLDSFEGTSRADSYYYKDNDMIKHVVFRINYNTGKFTMEDGSIARLN